MFVQPCTGMSDIQKRVASSFETQGLMATLGAQLVSVTDDEMQIALPFSERALPAARLLHASAITSIVDNACGYAALTKAPPECEIVSAEFKKISCAPRSRTILGYRPRPDRRPNPHRVHGRSPSLLGKNLQSRRFDAGDDGQRPRVTPSPVPPVASRGERLAKLLERAVEFGIDRGLVHQSVQPLAPVACSSPFGTRDRRCSGCEALPHA